MMTSRHPQRTLRDAVLDQEEPLTDLQAVLAALDLIASGDRGIDKDDMNGLRLLTKYARELANTLRQSWKAAVECFDAHDEADGTPSDGG